MASRARGSSGVVACMSRYNGLAVNRMPFISMSEPVPASDELGGLSGSRYGLEGGPAEAARTRPSRAVPATALRPRPPSLLHGLPIAKPERGRGIPCIDVAEEATEFRISAEPADGAERNRLARQRSPFPARSILIPSRREIE